MSDPKKIYRLANPFDKPEQYQGVKRGVLRVQADIPDSVYRKLFYGTLMGVRGTQLNLIGTFFYRLTQAIAQHGIPDTYEPDNEDRVAELVDRLNFDDPKSLVDAAYNTGYEQGLLHGRRATKVPGPANSKPARNKGTRNDRRGPKGVPQDVQNSPHVSTDVPSSIEGRVGSVGEETAQG